MTWGPNSTLESYTVDGVTTIWVTTIPFINPAWLKCYQSDGATFWTDVTASAVVTVAADPATGGTVTISPALAVANGSKLFFRLEMPIEQVVIALGPNSQLPSEAAEAAWDQAVMLIAMLAEQAARAPKFPDWLGLAIGPNVPAPVTGNVLAWDALGNLVNIAPPAIGQPLKGNVTLTANAFTTVVSTGAATSCLPTSHVAFTPTLTAGFSGDMASGEFYVVYGTGAFTIHHPYNANAARTASYSLII